jgi:hypothetical protein
VIPINRTTIIVALLAAAVLLAGGLFAWHEWTVSHAAKTEARVSAGQAGAAVASGKDAANTVGNRMDADAAEDTLTKENADAIRNADGASAPVAAPVRDAGLRSLCRRAAYSRDPKCLQHADPR